MKRLFVVACSAIVLAACGGGGSGPSLGVTGPPSAQSVAQGSSDFAGLQKCSENGSYETYLKAEQTKNHDQYATDKKTWDDLKDSGAEDSYIVDYASSNAHCGQIGARTPPGDVA